MTRAGVSRRTMLVGSGGLLLGVAASVGWTDGGLASPGRGRVVRRG